MSLHAKAAPMDDARLERLLTRPTGPRPEKPRRIADELREMARTDDGPAPHDMLKTRPKPQMPRTVTRKGELTAAGNPMPPHGDHRRYKNQGCRCEACTKAHAAKTKARDRANREAANARNRRYRARKKAERDAA